jgi:hypothetical protein
MMLSRVGLFQADGAVCASGVGAVVGIYGVVGGVNDAVSGVTLKLGDVPSSGSGHGGYQVEIADRFHVLVAVQT